MFWKGLEVVDVESSGSCGGHCRRGMPAALSAVAGDSLSPGDLGDPHCPSSRTQQFYEKDKQSPLRKLCVPAARPSGPLTELPLALRSFLETPEAWGYF